MLIAALALVTATAPTPAADDARVHALQTVLADETASARRWYFGWASGFLAAYAGGAIVAWKSPDVGLRTDARVGAFMSGLGFVSTVFVPPPAIFYGPTDDRAVLEERLASSAEFDAFARSWLPHALGIAANAAAGAYLWLHAHRFAHGLLQFAVGSAVSEAKLFTAPDGARAFTRENKELSLTPWIGDRAGGVAALAVW